MTTRLTAWWQLARDVRVRSAPRVLAVLVAVAGVFGCSSQQVYQAGQGWQRIECQKIGDLADRNRCLSSTSTSYEEYKRQSEAAKGSR